MITLIEKGRITQMNISGNWAGAYLKAKSPKLFYAAGYIPWSDQTHVMPDVNWRNYIRSLIKAGFDGIGEMGSKPVPRDVHTPLDDEYYKGFWKACESFDFPVLCHVADPEEFWDENLAPDWAKNEGWVYYVGDYPSKEELYSEMRNVLEAHPALKVVLCHFYFMSADLERAEDFLDQFNNANLDLTLGIELMYNISRRADDWRDFFIKYQDQILFGTDIASWQEIRESLDRIWLIRNFLESDEQFYTPLTADRHLTKYKEPFIGLHLPKEALRKIYANNFRRLWGQQPKEIDLDVVIGLCQENDERTIADSLRNMRQSSIQK